MERRRWSAHRDLRAAFALAAALTSGCEPETAATGDEARTGLVASADSVLISYEVHGQGGPALVFVHGWSCDRTYWYSQLEPFAQSHTVVAVDLAGHGQSGLGRDDYTMASFGQDVAAVVDTLGLDRVILIGHSMGGDVIVEAARRLEGRVAGLIWVDTYRELGTPRTPEQVEAMLAPFRADFAETVRAFVRGMFPAGADTALVERVADDMASAPTPVALSAIEHALTYGREIPQALASLNIPVIAINAAQPPTDTASMQRHGVEVERLEGVGHFLMMEDPQRFNALLRTVVERLGR